MLIIGDFNVEPDNPKLSVFLTAHELYKHMKEKTCWKSPNGTYIDLIISNKKHSLMNTGIIGTGISDHHSLIYTMLRSTYQRLPPKIINYRDWKYFDQNSFKLELSQYLHYNASYNDNDYYNFEKVFNHVLDKHEPTKTNFCEETINLI